MEFFSDQVESIAITKKFHLITNARQTWNKALHYCNSRGWRLAGITTKDDNDQIMKQITNTGTFYINREIRKFSKIWHKHFEMLFASNKGLRDHFWIGGTNLYNEPYFYWIGNDSPFQFTDWHDNEPNNVHLNEKCIEVWYYNNIYKWNDQSCRTRSYFICEERISKKLIFFSVNMWHFSLSLFYGKTVEMD